MGIRTPYVLAAGLVFFTGCISMVTPTEVRKDQLQQQKVCTLSGYSKDVIYRKSIQWVNKTFIPNKNVVQTKDLQTGLIVLIGNTNITYKVMGQAIAAKIYFLMKIDIKDNKVRLTFKDYHIKGRGDSSTAAKMPLQYESQADAVNKNLTELTDNYIAFIRGETNESW